MHIKRVKKVKKCLISWKLPWGSLDRMPQTIQQTNTTYIKTPWNNTSRLAWRPSPWIWKSWDLPNQNPLKPFLLVKTKDSLRPTPPTETYNLSWWLVLLGLVQPWHVIQTPTWRNLVGGLFMCQAQHGQFKGQTSSQGNLHVKVNKNFYLLRKLPPAIMQEGSWKNQLKSAELQQQLWQPQGRRTKKCVLKVMPLPVLLFKNHPLKQEWPLPKAARLQVDVQQPGLRPWR